MSHFAQLFILSVLLFLTLGLAPVGAALTIEDCQKCHEPERQQIALKGMAHKEKVSCLDCHLNHRPQVADNIPECGNCHEISPHEGIADCASCHKSKQNCKACHMAHQPFVWPAGAAAALHCSVCHPEASELLKNSPTEHHNLSCTFCHSEHRNIQTCSGCHGLPHSAGTHKMFPQCVACHNVAHDLNPR
jgi:hypothetical protein